MVQLKGSAHKKDAFIKNISDKRNKYDNCIDMRIVNCKQYQYKAD